VSAIDSKVYLLVITMIYSYSHIHDDRLHETVKMTTTIVNIKDVPGLLEFSLFESTVTTHQMQKRRILPQRSRPRK
jgi:hypothetical protein